MLGTVRIQAPVNYPQFRDYLQQLIQRIQGYPSQEVWIELAVLFALAYLILRFLRGTRGARAIKGMAMVIILVTILIKAFTQDNKYERLSFLYSNSLVFAGLAMVIVFQPEIRRAMVRLGEARLFLGPGYHRSRIIDELVGSLEYLSKNKIGALIAIERQVGLKGIVEGGTAMDAQVSKELLNTIFWPGSALHDMGLIIQGDRIVAAGVQFPLAEGDQFGTELGSRHRAAIGLSLEADALVLVVSEETGIISIAQRGKLIRNLTAPMLHQRLAKVLGRSVLADSVETETGSSNGNAA